jgi:hypothetical protein
MVTVGKRKKKKKKRKKRKEARFHNEATMGGTGSERSCQLQRISLLVLLSRLRLVDCAERNLGSSSSHCLGIISVEGLTSLRILRMLWSNLVDDK